MKFITCIIPFYNEGKRIAYTINQLRQVLDLNQIICIDDGSTDSASALLTKEFPTLKLISLPKNSGKSHAIKSALPFVKTKYVLLFDADLSNIKPATIKEAIVQMQKKLTIDMVIFYSATIPRIFSKWSGQRIVKTDDLKAVFSQFNPVGYQIEGCISKYMRINRKMVQYIPIFAKNPKKRQKYGIKQSLLFHAKIFYTYIFSDRLNP